MKNKKALVISLSIVAVLIIVLVVILAVKSRSGDSEDNPSEPIDIVVTEPTAKPTAEPTVEPTVEPTAEPTAEPTPSPEETLVSLREQAIAEHALIVEYVQTRFDIASEILEVAKGYPNFKENVTYENVLLAKSLFEENVLEGNINEILGSSISLNMVITDLLVEYPDLKTTEEFKKLVEIPIFDTLFYNSYVSAYNDTLSNITTSDFEELPYCTVDETQIEY